ncbi:MAG: DNA helicase RecQ [Alphaproteobacteria bacterium]|jgi:ATP-dependent DNA helicase RecQ|nr:DNA helicase RecQ [Alphaproteobacteria bacterium]
MAPPEHVDTAKQKILKDVFGFDDFRPGQEQVVDTLLAGESVLAVMPTGSGKSLCFQVPALVYGGLTIVVSPLVALMHDQVAALRLAGVAVETINSSRDRAENVAAWQRVTSGETRLLYLAPERLMTDRMLAALGKLDISLIAIDEAHCISQWGPAFRQDYQGLARLRDLFPGVPVAALTATADAVTRDDISAQLFAGNAKTVVLGFDRPNIKLTVEMKNSWKNQLLNFIEQHRGKSGIVYCLSRKKTEAAAEFLTENGVEALPYHAGMDKDARNANQTAFMNEPGTVVVATIAFGMGIDKPDVRFVFHVDLPGSPEAYYQEIGRAGRDGLAAEAHMLYGLDDIRMRRVFIEQEEAGEDRKRREHQRLDALIGYCESAACRRQALLAYFGEEIEPCGNCDICIDPIDMTDGTAEAQKILATVSATGQRYGAVHLIDVLRGSQSEKVTKAGHDRLPVFGSGMEHKKEDWRSLIRQLVAAGYLLLDVKGYGGLEVTEKGHALVHGDGIFQYRQDTVRRTPPPGDKARGKSRSKTPTENLSTTEALFLSQLKELRQRLAKERSVPAYVIFPDRSLIEMAQRQPKNTAEFAEIHGVGESKLRKFSVPFLEVIANASSAQAPTD